MKGLQTSLIIGFMSVAIIGLIGVTARLHRRLLRRQGRQRDHALRRHRPVAADLLPDPHHRRVLGRDRPRWSSSRSRSTGWTLACRLVRAEFLKLRETDFVQAGRALGASNRRIISRHMLPASLAPGRRGGDARHRRLGRRARRPSRSWASASARPRRASATCSRTSRSTSPATPSWILVPRR